MLQTAELTRFDYNDKGALAYLGADDAVMDITGVAQVKGFLTGYLWRGFETISQISVRNGGLQKHTTRSTRRQTPRECEKM